MTGTTPDADPLGRQLRVLSDPLRRRLLVALHESTTDGSEPLVDPDLLEERALELHHTHLPRLADAGYVEWEISPLVVRRGPRFDEIAPLLDALDERSEELVGTWPSPASAD